MRKGIQPSGHFHRRQMSGNIRRLSGGLDNSEDAAFSDLS
jgi:hypothetical protein